MNWKRGLLLAGINFVVAFPVVLSIQARTEKHARHHQRIENPPRQPQSSAPDERTVDFSLDPCEGVVEYPPPVVVVRLSNLPATVLTGWALLCPPPWSLSARLGFSHFGAPALADVPRIKAVDTLFLTLIPIQWFLIGAFPLVRPKWWFAEPGMFITLCTGLGAALALFPSLESLPDGPAALAGIMWLLWFGWLIWRTVRFLWRSTVRLLPRPAH